MKIIPIRKGEISLVKRLVVGIVVFSNLFSIAAPLAFAQTTTPVVDEVVVPASTTPDVEIAPPTTVAM